jgi:hypothetical protein
VSILESQKYKSAPWWVKVLINIVGVVGGFRGHVVERPLAPRPRPVIPPERHR